MKRVVAFFAAALFLVSCSLGAVATAPVLPTVVPPIQTSAAPPGVPATPVVTLPAIQHVFLIVMENHGYDEVWNSPSTPYITGLGNAYARATNYHAVTHPSLPNYLDLFAGGTYGINADCLPTACQISAVNLADNLEARGLTWKGYFESMPAPCTVVLSRMYDPVVNPFVYFADIRDNPARCKRHVVPYSRLAADLASASTTPNYAMIIPDLCSDMHNCSIATGDNWLSNTVPPILSSPACTVQRCLLIITWDEDDASQHNQVLTIFAGSAARKGGATSAETYSHYSVLHTIEVIFGLPTQTPNDAKARPMLDLLEPEP